MKRRNAEILLAAVIIARSTSLLFAKIGLGSIAPMNLLGMRFCVAFLVLCVIFWKKLPKIGKTELLGGACLGAAFFAVVAAEMFALKFTDTSTTSFIENTAIVLVPLAEAGLLRKIPDSRTLASAAVTLAGVGFLTLKSGVGLNMGIVLCVLTAVFYTAALILTDRFSRKGDPLLMGVAQVGFMGLFSMIASFLTESPRLPQGGREWTVILLLALVCSCFGFTLQPVAQKYTTSVRTSQLCALNPLTVAILGTLFLNESLGLFGFLGAGLILAGICLQSFWPASKAKTAAEIS